MAKRNRKTLKNFFRKGHMPTEGDFNDLIDSTVNIVDEGFSKSFSDGLKLSTVAGSDKLMSFFRDIEDKSPIWTCETDKLNNSLSFSNSEGEKILVLDEEKRVGINKEKPETALDVDGVITSTGRKGSYKSGLVPANGQWQPIILDLTGCNAFEIMAGVGKKKSGKYALLHAFALSTFYSKNKIIYHQSFFKTLCNTIKLKWDGSTNSYQLDIKTKSDYGPDIYINYFISQIWFDPLMDSCYKPKE